MNIVVCIKQVPDVDDIKWTKENNLDRSLMLSRINKFDEWALDWALNIKHKFIDVKITAISMGPKPAVDVLNYALAKGCSRAILLCDKKFAGSDTLATSKILSKAIAKYVPDYNLILTGQLAQDGDTAQVPVSLSQLLNILDVTNATEIINADKDNIIVRQKLDNKINIYEVKTPCLVAIKEECSNQYKPRIQDYVRAQSRGVEEYNFKDLNLESDDIGVVGSPTTVYKAFRPEINKETIKIEENYTNFILDMAKKVKFE